ncbi:hypothetical protein BDZ91DRAFT_64023 [Kalaharituber pfeilii]|nr:hypothetical protein BDZ91DRAFT_64023 [Kalaharituber pfeilii]
MGWGGLTPPDRFTTPETRIFFFLFSFFLCACVSKKLEMNYPHCVQFHRDTNICKYDTIRYESKKKRKKKGNGFVSVFGETKRKKKKKKKTLIIRFLGATPDEGPCEVIPHPDLTFPYLRKSWQMQTLDWL